jgi:hypothetical protein
MKRILSLTLMICLLIACGGTGTVIPDTPTPGEVAEAVLEKVADIVCPDIPNVRVFATDTGYGFWCAPAAGHSTTATLQWFSNPGDAQAAFETRREGRPVGEFHEFPLLAWDEDHPSFPGGRKEYRVWLWQAQNWLIEVRAFDDTHYTIAPDPGRVSEAIYQVGAEYDLFTVQED